MVFCPRCGSKDVIDTLCADCLRETEPLLKGHKDLTLTICPRCKSALIHGKWTPYKNINTLIFKQVKSKLDLDPNKIIEELSIVEQFDIEDLWEKRVKPKSLTLHVTGRLKEDTKSYTEEYEVPFILKKDICTVCNRQASNYFEGIIQLRNPKDEVVRYIKNQFKHLNKSGVYLTSVLETKDGLDFYVTDQKSIQQLGHDVISRFGGEIKITSKLMTRDKNTGKDLFRVTVLLRLPKYNVGDIISYNNVLLRIGKLSKHINGFDLMRGKHTQITIKNDADVVIHEQFPSTIVTLHPIITVMHPETFQPIPVANKLFANDFKINEKIKLVFFKNKYYIIPKKDLRSK